MRELRRAAKPFLLPVLLGGLSAAAWGVVAYVRALPPIDGRGNALLYMWGGLSSSDWLGVGLIVAVVFSQALLTWLLWFAVGQTSGDGEWWAAVITATVAWLVAAIVAAAFGLVGLFSLTVSTETVIHGPDHVTRATTQAGPAGDSVTVYRPVGPHVYALDPADRGNLTLAARQGSCTITKDARAALVMHCGDTAEVIG